MIVNVQVNLSFFHLLIYIQEISYNIHLCMPPSMKDIGVQKLADPGSCRMGRFEFVNFNCLLIQ